MIRWLAIVIGWLFLVEGLVLIKARVEHVGFSYDALRMYCPVFTLPVFVFGVGLALIQKASALPREIEGEKHK